VRQGFWLLMVALLPAVSAALLLPNRPVWSRTAAGVPEISWAEMQRWKAAALLVDARSEGAFEVAHIPEAVSLNETRWEDRLPIVFAAWKPGTRIVVYCDSAACGGSQDVARRLRRELGIDEIYVLKGGWQTWLQDHARTH